MWRSIENETYEHPQELDRTQTVKKEGSPQPVLSYGGIQIREAPEEYLDTRTLCI